MSRILYEPLKRGFEVYKLEIVCWSIFILYEIGVSGILIGRFENFWYYFCFYLLNITLFYVHAKVVLPLALNSTGMWLWKLPLSFLFELPIYCLISAILSNALEIALKGSLVSLMDLHFKYMTGALWRGIYFLLYSTVYFFSLKYIEKVKAGAKQQIEFEKLKTQLLQSEKDFLRAQINPHIIFNTLSYVRFAAKNKHKDTDEAINRLSSMMRYALEDNLSDKIPLKRELEQIDNLIVLTQLRFDNQVKIKYLKEIEDDNINLISLCIISLVENIFKHGYIFDENFPVQIEIKSDSEIFQFYSSNLVADLIVQNSNKTGLKNINLRLASLYPDSYEFKYGMVNRFFYVNLKIRLS